MAPRHSKHELFSSWRPASNHENAWIRKKYFYFTSSLVDYVNKRLFFALDSVILLPILGRLHDLGKLRPLVPGGTFKKQAYFGLPFQQEHSYIGKLWPQLTLASFCWDMKQRSLLDPSWKKDPAETCLTPKKRVKIRFQLFNTWTSIQCETLQARTTPGKQRDTRGRGREWKILTLYHKHFHHNIYLNSKT